jgi:hypothetical protein
VIELHTWVLGVVLSTPAAPVAPTPTVPLAEQLQDAERTVVDDPARGVERLREGLDAAASQPVDVATDPALQRARTYALLALTRALLQLERHAEARDVMDEAVRIARSDRLPVALYGPAVVELYEARRAAAENRPIGSLEVQCTVPCRVILDERLAGLGHGVSLTGVPLGRHRVWVDAPNDGWAEPLHRTIDLGPGGPIRLAYEPVAQSEPSPQPVPDGAPIRRRRLPRWAGVLGVATGAVLMITGGVLLGVDGRCPDLSDPRREDPCPDVLDTNAGGIALLAIGGATLTGFSVAFAIGEIRQHKTAVAHASLRYTLRF